MPSSIKKSSSAPSLHFRSSSFPPFHDRPNFLETMGRKAPTTLLLVFLCLVLSGLYSLHLSRIAIAGKDVRFLPRNLTTRPRELDSFNQAIKEDVNELPSSHRTRHVSSIQDYKLDSVSILLPGWEVLVVVSPEIRLQADSVEKFYCLYPNNATSPASFAGVLPFSNATSFKCLLPERNHRRRPFHQPVLTKYPDREPPVASPPPDLIRWSFLVYESLSTEDDVVVFAKGLNNRQGVNRSPNEFSCVFGEDANTAVRTAVTSSAQEVFRCRHPNITALASFPNDDRIKITVEILGEKKLVPSIAYYTPRLKLANKKPKSLVCACTMVYNVGKFMREWVLYHSKIGVDKFLLYDNHSSDDLERVIKEVNEEGFNVEKLLWVWPKTQEAGFSHSAIYAKDSCTWMMYIDVDEFLFSPSWVNAPQPSKGMLKSLLPRIPDKLPPSSSHSSWNHLLIGQVSVKCNDFGPSNQKEHPVEGVTQGYTCRRRIEQRHKSIVLLDAVHHSLLNVIHHFDLNERYFRSKELSLQSAVVNHYKYQAWPEFKNKFRRRVSAYVVDWTQAVNLASKDRTPGLGFEAIEPSDWAQKFCDVKDERLKSLAQRWFGSQTPSGHKMAWQR